MPKSSLKTTIEKVLILFENGEINLQSAVSSLTFYIEANYLKADGLHYTKKEAAQKTILATQSNLNNLM